MYILKNDSKKNVLILDLGIIFYPGEVKDLDLHFDRNQLENSKYLKSAINGEEKLLIVLQKDEVINNVNIDKLVEEKLKQINQSNQNQQSMEEVNKKIDILLNVISDLKNNPIQQTIIQNAPNESIKEEKIVDNNINDEQIIDIHSRAVKRITKDVSGSVSSEETKKDSNLDNKIDELEGFL